MADMYNYHFVMSSYSHTDRRQLWQVCSKPFIRQADADTWMEYMQSEEPKKEFFVIDREMPRHHDEKFD